MCKVNENINVISRVSQYCNHRRALTFRFVFDTIICDNTFYILEFVTFKGIYKKISIAQKFSLCIFLVTIISQQIL